MRKRIFLNSLIAASFAIGLAFMSGCEGPEGPMGPQGPPGADGQNGTDGTNGVDGNVTCLQCHSADMPATIQAQFAQSEHSAGAVAVEYAGGRASCARCHSSEGFIEFARTGTVDGDITAPSAWECKTCHSIHTTFEQEDFALRLADPVKMIFDDSTVVDLGESNLCANCHQSRRAEPYMDAPADSFAITSTHYGPHHGPQANVLYGVGFAEIPGTYTYPEPGTFPHVAEEEGKCVGCHMYTYGNGAGGHTWNPSLDACNDCHGANEPDFNHGNIQERVEGLLDDLRDLLVAQGVVEFVNDEHYELNPETGDIELVVTPEGYEPIVGTYPMIQAQAFFNWIGLEEDRSEGVHNPNYVEALLENTIEALETLP